MPILAVVISVFWGWMVLDFLYRRSFEEDFASVIVFFTPVGALAYFFKYYLPTVSAESTSLGRSRRFKHLTAIPGQDLTIDNLRELGDLYRDRRAWTQALRCYEQVLQRLPHQHATRMDAANCLLELRKSQEAIPLLREVVQQAPHYRETATLLLSECLGDAGNWNGALDALEAGRPYKVSPQWGYQRARCLSNSGRRDEARVDLEHLIAQRHLFKRREQYWIGQAKQLLKTLG